MTLGCKPTVISAPHIHSFQIHLKRYPIIQIAIPVVHSFAGSIYYARMPRMACNCRLITYWPARSMLSTHFISNSMLVQKFESTRIARHIKRMARRAQHFRRSTRTLPCRAILNHRLITYWPARSMLTHFRRKWTNF